MLVMMLILVFGKIVVFTFINVIVATIRWLLHYRNATLEHAIRGC